MACLPSLDWGLLGGRASCGRTFCPWNPACFWHSLYSTPRNFQILVAEPFPPPTLSHQGTHFIVGRTAHKQMEKRQPGQVHAEGSGREVPPTWCRASAFSVCFCRVRWADARFFCFFFSCFWCSSWSWQGLGPSVLAFCKAMPFLSQVPEGPFLPEATFGSLGVHTPHRSLTQCPAHISCWGRTNEKAEILRFQTRGT